MLASQQVGVWSLFSFKQQDQGVFAQQVYYTNVKPTNAATLPGGSPDTYSAYCSLVSSLARAHCYTSSYYTGVPVSEVILNGYSKCFSRRLQRHSIRVTFNSNIHHTKLSQSSPV